MSVKELSRDQLQELKGNLLFERSLETGESIGWGAFAYADELVSDEECFDYYSGTDFSTDDFGCSAGQYR